jgi:Zn-dependent protease
MAGPDFWIASVAAVIIHEAAHVAIAWTHGVQIKRVGISWRGPFIVREQGEPTADAKIAIAGPLANLLLALACWHLAPLFAQINLILGGYNLLPFIPRNDGRHAWDAVRRMRNAVAGSATPFN